MIENKLDFILFGLMAICLVLLGFVSGNAYSLYSANNVNIKNMLSNVNNYNCDNLSLLDTSECLNNDLKRFFKYNLSNAGKEIDLEKLKNEGGVCSHASNWYKESLVNIGYKYKKQDEILFNDEVDYKGYVTECRMSVDKTNSHIITITSNKEGYCILDQIRKECIEFQGREVKNE